MNIANMNKVPNLCRHMLARHKYIKVIPQRHQILVLKFLRLASDLSTPLTIEFLNFW